jgi:hypothetical protein
MMLFGAAYIGRNGNHYDWDILWVMGGLALITAGLVLFCRWYIE